MLAKRIIPCLDIKNGRTVKGVNFNNIIDAGCPIKLAEYYSNNGADEITFLDIMATLECRDVFYDIIKKIASRINIPITVGGGINSIGHVYKLLNSGADKVSINTAAVKNPKIVYSLAQEFGSQCIVVAIDILRKNDTWFVASHAGTNTTNIKAIDFAREVYNNGAGEILLTSMDNDGTQKGFAIDIIKEIVESIKIPVIASGGAGCKSHFNDVFTLGKADAALAASVFHYGKIKIPTLKNYLVDNKVIIRK